MFKILFPGEMLIDQFSKQNKTIDKIGGAPTNAAGAVAKLGIDAVVIGSVGNDAFGKHIVKTLKASAINVAGVQISKKPTTVAHVTIDEHGERSFTFARGADEDLDYEAVSPELTQGYAALHLGSATAMLGGELLKAYDKFLSDATTNSKIVCFDPNFRDALYENKVKKFKTKSKQIIKASTIVKLSLEEVEILFETTDYEAAAQKILASGPLAVLITLGKKGSYLATPNFAEHVPTIKVKQIDTTGAGDTFIGFFLGLLVSHGYTTKRWPTQAKLVELVKYASVAAALSTTKIGALESIPSWDEVKKAYNKKELWN